MSADLVSMSLSNDEKGCIMTLLSGTACVFGASIICVDIIIRQFPGKKNFRIQDSDAFLSASLSLSFGVMVSSGVLTDCVARADCLQLFSALYSILPSSKRSLIDGGFTAKQASWILIACFLGGVLGIQVVSKVVHRFIPSHVVDCENPHGDEEASKNEHHSHADGIEHPHPQLQEQRPQLTPRNSLPVHMPSGQTQTSRRSPSGGMPSLSQAVTETEADDTAQRPSLQQGVPTTISQLAPGKNLGRDCSGSCHGYSEPCGTECFKNINARGGFRAPEYMASGLQKPPMPKSATATTLVPATETTPLLQEIEEEDRPQNNEGTSRRPTRYYTTRTSPTQEEPSEDSSETLEDSSAHSSHNDPGHLHKANAASSHATEAQGGDKHHHHVPTNAFLSIGLQTSIAIALHKLPEGFITYATNHANPSLGVSVFLALFIHNITEGFAMALPLYLAVNSRVKAMLISFVLGGLSPPIGAGVAAVWFKLAGNGDWAPSEGVYGGMFAVTAGIMASVALSLFGEALDLTHSRNLCFVSAFCGMGILGVSSALTA